MMLCSKPLFRTFLSLILCALGGEVYGREFRSSDVNAYDFPTVRAVAFMDRRMREQTDGRLSIGALGANAQTSENFTIGEVRNASIDMARVGMSALHGTVPMTAVLSLPFLFRSIGHLRNVLDGPIGEEILASFEPYGLVGLCFYETGFRSLYAAKPIRTPGDLAGMRIRIQQSSISVGMMKTLGARPAPLTNHHVHALIVAGEIDGAQDNFAAYVAWQHYKVAKAFSPLEHSAEPSVLVFSKRVWDQLSVQEQAIIREAAKESVSYFREVWNAYLLRSHQVAQAEGVQIVSGIDRDAFVQRLAPLDDLLVSDRALQTLVRRIRSAN